MRHPGSYRGARRDEAKRLHTGHEAGFVEFWRQMMPDDGAREVRASDWRRYTDTKERARANQATA